MRQLINTLSGLSNHTNMSGETVVVPGAHRFERGNVWSAKKMDNIDSIYASYVVAKKLHSSDPSKNIDTSIKTFKSY